MVKFLLQRPIAVLMAFTACFIVGLVTYFTLPVSLLPDIAIPQITVQVSVWVATLCLCFCGCCHFQSLVPSFLVASAAS